MTKAKKSQRKGEPNASIKKTDEDKRKQRATLPDVELIDLDLIKGY